MIAEKLMQNLFIFYFRDSVFLVRGYIFLMTAAVSWILSSKLGPKRSKVAKEDIIIAKSQIWFVVLDWRWWDKIKFLQVILHN